MCIVFRDAQSDQLALLSLGLLPLFPYAYADAEYADVVVVATDDLKPAPMYPREITQDYVDYVEGIRKVNPKVVIFIESTTGVTRGRQGKTLNSRNVAELNRRMKKYCSKHKDMYFVDVASKLNDANGYLKNGYASDNHVHLTFPAYGIWMSELTKYTDALMLEERAAKQAVKTAEKTRSAQDIKWAKGLVSKLESSTVKSNLKKRLNKIK